MRCLELQRGQVVVKNNEKENMKNMGKSEEF